MKKAKVLFVSQEMTPYSEKNHLANICRKLPQAIQEKGKEIRVFVPRFGSINERRNQLHEVIRLSGMNLIINDTDHPLIIKVASIQAARMQVYFIDNEEFFKRKSIFHDKKGAMHPDNDERAIFFCRGVLETVKKLGWAPDIIHCHGWMTSLLPMYLKKSYADYPMFENSKVVYSLYNDDFKDSLDKDLSKKAMFEGLNESDLNQVLDPNFVNLNKLAIEYSDAIIKGESTTHSEIESFLKQANKPTLDFKEENEFVDAYSNFYDEILAHETILS
jgi:starch synthase